MGAGHNCGRKTERTGFQAAIFSESFRAAWLVARAWKPAGRQTWKSALLALMQTADLEVQGGVLDVAIIPRAGLLDLGGGLVQLRPA